MISGMTESEQPRYSLSELTDEAGVSVRTVRYYIAEGLLPPPVTAGPRSFYTQAHLDRLRLIDRLKASYLPLKEIRRRLTALDDEEIQRLVEAAAETPPPSAIQEAASRPPDSAASYIARLLHTPAPTAPASPSPMPLQAGLREHDRVLARRIAPDEEEVSAMGRLFDESNAASPPETELEGTSWRRIPLGDDAELLIRDGVYQRKRERVDWLVGWARRVFG
jgi:DNA-binding transcriptional MerR regulator